MKVKICEGQQQCYEVQGMNGSDFMAWQSEGELVSDLRLPPFAARKLLASREKFLSAP